MTQAELVSAAARNNAEWCDVFCRAHGIVGRLDEDAWVSAARTPPYYPDAVTLVPGVDPRALLDRVDRTGGCSVKDSFADLDLAPFGFRPLFDATWLRWEGPVDAPLWQAVSAAGELARWEHAWAADGEPGFFRPALLDDDRVRFFGGRDGGAIAFRSEDAIGLSNVFGRIGNSWHAGAAAAAAEWGPLPIVGYEAGDELDAVRAAGAAALGSLVVWTR
jgi:hypothetical protein